MATSAPKFAAGLDSSIQALQDRFGMIVAGRDLVRLLGYRTSAAFRQAVHRKSLGVQTFFIRGRRGRCARTSDVARWAFEYGVPLMQGADFKSTPDRLK
ncbi:MAG TPA: hypothetical protein VGE64_13350 [Xanthomonadaceae bacterium]|jgi:hypothetical protein